MYRGWSYFVIFKKATEDGGGGGGHDRMLVGFTQLPMQSVPITTNVVSF